MRGIDVSHWNGDIDFEKVEEDGYRYAFIKCSQGVNFKDDKYFKNKKEIRKTDLMFGAYHYANGDSPVAEAKHFLGCLGELKKGDILILDYERTDKHDPADWCLRFLRYIEMELGYKPMLYTYHSLLKRYNWRAVSSNDNGLWAARYGLQTQEPIYTFQPATGSWPFWAIWQYCSRGKVSGITGNVDLNETKMTEEQFLKYGMPGVDCNHECPKHC